jgi:uncharacterized protein YndB with AHSA1/START domain
VHPHVGRAASTSPVWAISTPCGNSRAISWEYRAPVEEVWKLLFGPARFPDWRVGVETVRLFIAGAMSSGSAAGMS